MKDIYVIEADYLENHPDTGYFTEIIGLKTFPDYIDYLPQNAIPRKIKVMGYLPQKTYGEYSKIAMTVEEYESFLDNAIAIVVNAILIYKNSRVKCKGLYEEKR